MLNIENEARQTLDIATDLSRALTIAECPVYFSVFFPVDSQAEDRPRRRNAIMPIPFESLLPYGIIIVVCAIPNETSPHGKPR